MTQSRRSHHLCFALALLAGCNGGGTDVPDIESATLTGTWRGGFNGETARMSAVLNLTEQDTVIAGDGAISGSGIECTVDVDGRIRGERILFNIYCLQFPPIQFRGSFTSATRLDGTVAGSGIPPNSMRLIKQ